MKLNKEGFPVHYELDQVEYLKYSVKVEGHEIGIISMAPEVKLFHYKNANCQGSAGEIREAVRTLWSNRPLLH